MPPVQIRRTWTVHNASCNLSPKTAPRGKSHILPKQAIWGSVFTDFKLLCNWNLFPIVLLRKNMRHCLFFFGMRSFTHVKLIVPRETPFFFLGYFSQGHVFLYSFRLILLSLTFYSSELCPLLLHNCSHTSCLSAMNCC